MLFKTWLTSKTEMRESFLLFVLRIHSNPFYGGPRKTDAGPSTLTVCIQNELR